MYAVEDRDIFVAHIARCWISTDRMNRDVEEGDMNYFPLIKQISNA
jgi:hypothetical protein